MKYFHVLALLALVGIFGTACTRVEPGYVGIKVNLHGDNRGVSADQIVTGRVFFNPLTTNVYEFPTFTQRFAWTANPAEGSPNDESITFNSNEGASINVDVAFATAFNGEAVPALFTEFRREAGDIVDGWVRDQVRNCLNEVGSTMKAVSLLGSGKMTFINGANECVRRVLEPKGFTNVAISLINEARASERVRESIAAVIEQTQTALRAEAKVRQAQAEAEQVAATAEGEKAKRIAEADGAAQAVLLAAQADASAISLRATAQAEANRVLAESLSEELISYESVRRWNGILPRFTGGGAVPFINVEGKD